MICQLLFYHPNSKLLIKFSNKLKWSCKRNTQHMSQKKAKIIFTPKNSLLIFMRSYINTESTDQKLLVMQISMRELFIFKRLNRSNRVEAYRINWDKKNNSNLQLRQSLGKSMNLSWRVNKMTLTILSRNCRNWFLTISIWSGKNIIWLLINSLQTLTTWD